MRKAAAWVMGTALALAGCGGYGGGGGTPPTPGPAASVAVNGGTPQSASVGTAFASALSAIVRDRNGYAVSGAMVTFTAPARGASGSFAGSGAAATATTLAAGLATAPAFTANATAGAYAVTATVSGVATAATFALTNTSPSGTNITAADAARLLEQSGFGATPATVQQVQQLGFKAYLAAQFAAPAFQFPMPDPSVTTLAGTQQAFFNDAINGADQLRLRVMFALSQIWVISGFTIPPQGMAPYLNLLQNDAFGNYLQLMQDVTLSPGMGRYLDMVNNDKGNLALNLKPNENYAREFLQLFTIGLYQLNADGTRKLDSSNNPIPTYGQNVVDGNAAVMTGWTYPPTPGIAPANHNPQYWAGAMVPTAANHDATAKTILDGVTIAAGGTAQGDLRLLLQTVFNHPNVGPFVSNQLIEHLVTSNPSPSYVRRVAAVFDNDGSGVRGNLQAVVSAILLDPEARADTPSIPNPAFGHLCEPVVYVANLLRELGATTDGAALAGFASGMGENLFNPPSVFNYFPPDYEVKPGVLGPEFALDTTATAAVRANFVNTLAFGTLGPTTTLNWTALTALAANSDPSALINQLDTQLTLGEMPATVKAEIGAAIVLIPASSALARAENAVYLFATAPEFNVAH